MKKAKPKAAAKKAADPVNAADVEQAVLLLVKGTKRRAVELYLQKQGATEKESARVIADAKNRIALAADFDRNEELGLAIARTEDIFAMAIAQKDLKTALAAGKERNRLRGLYVKHDGGVGGGLLGAEGVGKDGGGMEELQTLRETMRAIEGHVLPLKLGVEGYPLEEMVRVLARKVSQELVSGS